MLRRKTWLPSASSHPHQKLHLKSSPSREATTCLSTVTTRSLLVSSNVPLYHFVLLLILSSQLVVTPSTAFIQPLIAADQTSSSQDESASGGVNNDSPSSKPQAAPPKILVHPKNVTVLDRRAAILICEAEGDPKPSLTWYKDGSRMNKHRTPIIKYNNGILLKIEPFKNDRDSGVYECLVENGVGEPIRSQVHVMAIPKNETPSGFPQIVSQPIETQKVEIGGVATINCLAEGDPSPEYLWLHESEPVRIPDPNQRIAVENGALRIYNVTESDKGTYLCVADNIKGLVTSSTSELQVSLEPLPDEPPTDLKFKLTSPTDVTITWSPPETKNNVTITGYRISIGKLNASESKKIELPNINRWAKDDLEENTEYAFRVSAKSRGGYGRPSRTISFTTPKDSPPAPTNVNAKANSYTSAMVWWDETAYFSGIVGYRVYYTIYNRTSTEMQINDLDRWLTKNISLTSSTIISNLVENSEYEVRVCAVSVNFSGKLSPSKRFRTLPEEVPYDLRTLELTTHSVKLTWKPPLDLVPSKYRVTYDAPEKSFLDNKGVRQQLSIPPRTLYTNNTSTQIVIYDLMPYTKYRINVTAVPSKEEFKPPVTVQITTSMAAPKQMSEPTLFGISNNGREIEVFLPLASEEFGPVGHYYVIVVRADMPSKEPDSYTTADLIAASSSPNPDIGTYIAARFSKAKMVKRFVLGDNKIYDGYLNRPLNKDQQYHVFVRAVVEHSDSLYTSSLMSEPISLSQPKSPPPSSPLTNESTKKVRNILIFTLFLVLVLAVIVTAFYRKQRQALKTNQMNETTIRLLPDPIYSAVPAEPLDRRGMNYQSRAMMNHPAISISELADHIEVMKMNNNLKEEYESIEPGQQLTWEHSYMDYNRSKNRYGNVVAYDHSRVILNQIDAIPGSDYINANYCDGYNKPNHYIATQGPLPNTVHDFWRMVWEQKSRTIVMMTQLEERGRVKCVQFWPSRDSVTYHGITITACDVEELAYYNIRTFRLQLNNEIREVKQFQFTAWPDHGVPDHPTPFLMFLRRIKASNPVDAGPMIVLCSAGVGRTGCFIVIDSMIERIKQESTIDIYGHVTSLRAQRNYIVQTEDQYMFIHDAVLEAVIASNTEVPVSKLTEHLHKLLQVVPNEGATGLELEFKRLASMKYSAQKFISANLPINKHKNRLMNILPYESTRVCLEPIPGIEGSDYINASFCDGYRQRNAYIATQSPLPETVEDTWRMLIEHNSGIIVMLTKLKEMGREKCTQYWPAERYGDYGSYRIYLTQEYNTTLNYILREFNVTDSKDPNYSRTIRQFHYLNWPEQVSLSEQISLLNLHIHFSIMILTNTISNLLLRVFLNLEMLSSISSPRFTRLSKSLA